MTGCQLSKNLLYCITDFHYSLVQCKKAGVRNPELPFMYGKEKMEPEITEIIARRQFMPLYIWLDIAFLLLFAGLLLSCKKYMTVLVGFCFGIIYMLVDYGIFHLVCHARSISPGHSLFWVLLWMSMSYGFTNFAWIWLWISRDRHIFEWSLLILLWWFCCPLLVQTFGADQTPIVIERTTGAYHGYMALLLFIGYGILIVYNLRQPDHDKHIRIPWLLAMGILVQFGWEAGLLIGGIRSAGFATTEQKLSTLLVNSLLETNLGMPYIYLLFIAYSRRFTEQLKRRPQVIGFTDRIRENNQE